MSTTTTAPDTRTADDPDTEPAEPTEPCATCKGGGVSPYDSSQDCPAPCLRGRVPTNDEPRSIPQPPYKDLT